MKIEEIINKKKNEKKNLIGLVGRVFSNGLGDWSSIPSRIIPKTI